jgi:hypothetical protein
MMSDLSIPSGQPARTPIPARSAFARKEAESACPLVESEHEVFAYDKIMDFFFQSCQNKLNELKKIRFRDLS